MRGLTRLSWPVWLLIIGVVLVVPGAVSATFLVAFQGLRLLSLLRPGLAPPLTLALLGLAVIGAVVFAIGLVAYVVVGSLSHERAKRGYGSIGTILACLGVAVIVANLLTLPYAIFQQAHQPGATALTPAALVLSVVTLDGALLGIVYLRIVHPKVLSWSELGLTSADLGERVRLGILLGIGVIVGTALIELGLRAVGVQQTQEQMFSGVLGATPAQFLGVLLAGAVIAPICEEIFFRGYVFTAVRRTGSVVGAFVMSSVLFALAHLNLQAFIPILFIGFTFAYVYWRTKSLVPSMIAHAMNNALALTALYISRHG